MQATIAKVLLGLFIFLSLFVFGYSYVFKSRIEKVLKTNEDIALTYIKNEYIKKPELVEDKDTLELVLKKAQKIISKRSEIYLDEYSPFEIQFSEFHSTINLENKFISIYSNSSIKLFFDLEISSQRRTVDIDAIPVFDYPSINCMQSCEENFICDLDLGDCIPEIKKEEPAKKTPRAWRPWRGNRIFVSSTTYSGDLISEAQKILGKKYSSGIEAADALCQSRARAGKMTGRFKALISSSQADARDRFAANHKVYLSDKKTLANLKDIWDGKPDAFIDYDEFGKRQKPGRQVWTGTDPTGFKQSSLSMIHCEDWSSTSGTGRAGISSSRMVGPYFNWISYGAGASCSEKRALYCYQ